MVARLVAVVALFLEALALKRNGQCQVPIWTLSSDDHPAKGRQCLSAWDQGINWNSCSRNHADQRWYSFQGQLLDTNYHDCWTRVGNHRHLDVMPCNGSASQQFTIETQGIKTMIRHGGDCLTLRWKSRGRWKTRGGFELGMQSCSAVTQPWQKVFDKMVVGCQKFATVEEMESIEQQETLGLGGKNQTKLTDEPIKMEQAASSGAATEGWVMLRMLWLLLVVLLSLRHVHFCRKPPEELTELHNEIQKHQQDQSELVRKVDQGFIDLLKALSRLADDIASLRVLKADISRIENAISTMSIQTGNHESSDTSSIVAGSSDSWIRVDAGQPCCYHPDTIFQVGVEAFSPAKMMYQGCKVVAANGEVIEVAHPPELHQVPAVILLQAEQSFLPVSPDHRILVPGNKTVQAQKLSKGDLVMLDGTEAILTSLEWVFDPTMVLKISFRPDLPVAAFPRPPSILTKGSRRKPLRRGKKSCSHEAGDAMTIPDTEGYITD